MSSGQIATSTQIARFAAWLLLDVGADRCAATEWDIRDTSPHPKWSDGPLYPNATADD